MTEPVAGPLKKTPLHASHIALGARMVPFGGWDMPVEYSGITAEHMAVRTAAGLFEYGLAVALAVMVLAAHVALRRLSHWIGQVAPPEDDGPR